MQFLQVQTTLETEEQANELAEKLVEEKLAACAQVLGPIRSHYHWEGKREDSVEWLCLLKTSEAKYPDLEKRILELHEYDNPEVIAVLISQTSEKYAAWIQESIE